MINKTNKKLITFTDRHIEMMEEISLKNGLEKPSAIVARGIEELHSKYYKPYATAGSMGNSQASEDAQIKGAQIKAKAKEAEKDAREDLKNKRKYMICTNILGGEIGEDNKGDKICTYVQYSLTGDNIMSLPIGQMDPVLAETSLFMPSQNSVFNNRPDVEKMWKKRGLNIIKLNQN